MESIPAYGIRYANVVAVDPARFRIRSASAQRVLGRRLATLPEIVGAVPGAVAAVNASFFSQTGTVFTGFYMEEGEKAPHGRGQKTVFYETTEGSVGISPERDLDPGALSSAVAGYTAGSREDPTARSAVCITGDGGVKLVTAYPVKTLNLMTRYLREAEGCLQHLHLDGGGSTQMSFQDASQDLSVGWERDETCTADGSGRSPEQCHREVASILVVVPR